MVNPSKLVPFPADYARRLREISRNIRNLAADWPGNPSVYGRLYDAADCIEQAAVDLDAGEDALQAVIKKTSGK